MNALTLNPRPIRSLKPVDDAGEDPQVIPSGGHYVWLNSSYELEHGLEVVELNDALACDTDSHAVNR